MVERIMKKQRKWMFTKNQEGSTDEGVAEWMKVRQTDQWWNKSKKEYMAERIMKAERDHKEPRILDRLLDKSKVETSQRK